MRLWKRKYWESAKLKEQKRTHGKEEVGLKNGESSTKSISISGRRLLGKSVFLVQKIQARAKERNAGKQNGEG